MLIRMSLIIGAGLIASAVYLIGPRGSDSSDLAESDAIKLQTLMKSPELGEGLVTLVHGQRNPAAIVSLESEDSEVEFPAIEVLERENSHWIVESQEDLLDPDRLQFTGVTKRIAEEGARSELLANIQTLEEEIKEDSQRLRELKALGLEEDVAIVSQQLEAKHSRLEELGSQSSDF